MNTSSRTMHWDAIEFWHSHPQIVKNIFSNNEMTTKRKKKKDIFLINDYH